jgi:hypothetical protein
MVKWLVGNKKNHRDVSFGGGDKIKIRSHPLNCCGRDARAFSKNSGSPSKQSEPGGKVR